MWDSGVSKLTQDAINSPPMQLCMVDSTQVAAMGYANLLHLTGTKTSIIKI